MVERERPVRGRSSPCPSQEGSEFAERGVGGLLHQEVTARQAATADVGRPPSPDVERVEVDGDGRRRPIAPPQRPGIYARDSIPAVPALLVTEP
jgi:hypothetical protein